MMRLCSRFSDMGLVQQGKASLALFNRVFWVAQWSFTAWFMGIWPMANIIQGQYIIKMPTGIIVQGEQHLTGCPKILPFWHKSLLKNIYEVNHRLNTQLHCMDQFQLFKKKCINPYWVFSKQEDYILWDICMQLCCMSVILTSSHVMCLCFCLLSNTCYQILSKF